MIRKNTEVAFSYDKEKYREMIFDAAEIVLGYFGFNRTLYGNKKNTGTRKWRWNLLFSAFHFLNSIFHYSPS